MTSDGLGQVAAAVMPEKAAFYSVLSTPYQAIRKSPSVLSWMSLVEPLALLNFLPNPALLGQVLTYPYPCSKRVKKKNHPLNYSARTCPTSLSRTTPLMLLFAFVSYI
jgi:hypothetical protein